MYQLVSRLKNDEFCGTWVRLLTYHIVSQPANVLIVIGHLDIGKSFLRQGVLTISETTLLLRHFNIAFITVDDMKNAFGVDMKRGDISVPRGREVWRGKA